MSQEISKNKELEEWTAANETDIKEWAVQRIKEYYKKAITSNSIWLAVFILVTFWFLSCLVQVLESFGDNGVGLLLILGLIEAFYLVTGIAFSLPSMLARCIVRYREIAKGNVHVVFARCMKIHAKGEDGWRDVVLERLDDQTEVAHRWMISEEHIESELGTIQCLVYIGDKLCRAYKAEDARWELSKPWWVQDK